MNKDLTQYVKTYKLITEEACNDIVAELQTANWTQHQFYIPSAGIFTPINGSKELDVCYKQTSYAEDLGKGLKSVFQRYIDELNYHWFNKFVCCTSPRFNRYSAGRIMGEHCDHIHSIFSGEPKGIPILTAVGSLNNDYDGGEFIMWGDTEIKIKAGEIMVFPSVFLYPHKVNEVTSGTRYTFVSWAC